jgi:hypothetical protein
MKAREAKRGDKGSDEAMTDTLLHDALSLAMRLASCVCHAARLMTALFALPCWFIVWLAFGAGPTDAASSPAFQPPEVWPVEAMFRQAIQLWADERFEALWEHGLRASRYRISREVFVRGMRHRVVKPTCCWDQIHAVRVHLQATDEAFVEAQVGIDVKTLGTSVRRSMIVYLRHEEGGWRVTLEDFLNKPEDAQSSLRAPW